MIISMIVAMDEKGGIGKDNRLPWHLPSDLKRFKKITMGHHIVMGRKTYETIGKPLPGRKMIVLTRNNEYQLDGCVVAHSIPEAIEVAEKNGEDELVIIGGGDVFEETIRIANKLYITYLHAVIGADTFFPKIDERIWKSVRKDGPIKQEGDEYSTEFEILVRKSD